MKKTRSILTAVSLFIYWGNLLAQPSLQKMRDKRSATTQNQVAVAPFKMTVSSPTKAAVLFDKNAAITQNSLPNWLSGQLGLRAGVDELRFSVGSTITSDKLEVKKLRQFYNGIPVEHGVIASTGQNDIALMMQMEFYSIPDGFNTLPSVAEEKALLNAMNYTKARQFSFTDNLGNIIAARRPKGELVIIRDYTDENEEAVCLAYKFLISASQPLLRSHIYVNAANGKVVLENALIKHAQQEGIADTRYSGRQKITTTFVEGGYDKPYILSETRNRHGIYTLNYNRFPYNDKNIDYDDSATNFADNDNQWLAAEFDNANKDNAATEVHFNLEVVSDYWWQEHIRRSWDDEFGDVYGYVHVWNHDYDTTNPEISHGVKPITNAFWNGSNLYFSDGDSGNNVICSLDEVAHEFGHAVTQATSNLVYRWESGALNEGFSDIWAACATNFVTSRYNVGDKKMKWRLGEETIQDKDLDIPGARDMKDPLLFEDPSTYGDEKHFYRPATPRTCPIESGENDHCGVHHNSGVLNKWFYLITDGETGTNSLGRAYNIQGLGFQRSQRIAYLTTLNLTPNATYASARIVSTLAAATLFGEGSVEEKVVKDAWVAVNVDSNIYNMSNTPAFTTDNFISIGVGFNGHIWAGSVYNGLYIYNDTVWKKRPELTNVRINSIAADKAGGIWVGQSGVQANSSQAVAGGVNYFPTPNSLMTFYTNSVQSQIPSRNVRCMYVDTSVLNEGHPKVWAAMGSYIQTGSGQSSSGMLGQGLYTEYRQFHPVSEGIDVAAATRGCLSVGGKPGEVWTFVQNNFSGKSQLLQYNSLTNALIKAFDSTNVLQIKPNTVVRSIYFDAKGRGWFGLASGGVLIYDEDKYWHAINFYDIFPPGTVCNFNAITGDKFGDVYIGTTSGVVMFDHGEGQNLRLDQEESYHRFTKENGLPSDNINALAYDSLRYKLLTATDKGIGFFDPPCYAKECQKFADTSKQDTYAAYSVGAGNWGNPAVWSTGKVPDSLAIVTISHPIVVNVNAQCLSLEVKKSGSIHVNTGVKFTIHTAESTDIQTGRKKRQTTSVFDK